MSFLDKTALLLGGLVICAHALADVDEDYETRQWQEMDVQFPAAPRDETLQPFFVSAANENRFFVDLATLSVGADGVVRYVMVVLTPAGARNVTYEGMRCETKERRIYASGRRDGAWSKARNGDWLRIQEGTVGRQYAALFLDYFCPVGSIIRSAAEAAEALRRGERPDNSMRW